MSKLCNLVFWACHHANDAVLQECIESNHKVNLRNPSMKTALMVAAANNISAVQTLTRQGAAFDLIDFTGTSAFGYAHRQEVLLYFLSIGAKCIINDPSTRSRISTEIALNIFSKAMDKQDIDKVDQRGLTPFMWAIWHQSFNPFHYYLKQGADVNQCGDNGVSPLMVACLHQNFYFIMKLIQRGADVNHLDENGLSALCYLISPRFRSEMAHHLLVSGADINLRGPEGKTPLMLAALNNNKAAFEYFLSEKAAVDLVDGDGNTALAYAVINCNASMVKQLLDKGAQPDLSGPGGKPPLFWAVIANKPEMVEYLIGEDADVHCVEVDNHDRNALHYAKKHNLLGIIDILARKYNEDVQLSVFQAIEMGRVNLVRFLAVNHGNLTETNEFNVCPLAFATHFRNVDMIRCVLACGGILDVTRALPNAIQTERVDIVGLFVESGAKVNRFCEELGMTPLMQAVCQEHLGIVELLLKMGATPNTGEVVSPLRKAVLVENYMIVDCLINYGAFVDEIDRAGESIMGTAIRMKNLSIITRLVACGVSVECEAGRMLDMLDDDYYFWIVFQKIFMSVEAERDERRRGDSDVSYATSLEDSANWASFELEASDYS